MLGANQPFICGGKQSQTKGGVLNDKFGRPEIFQNVNDMNNIKFN